MRIAIIGSGNVATILGKMIKGAGHTVIQVMSRKPEHAEILANLLGCSYTGSESLIDMSADIYVFAVSDSALFEIPNHFHLKNKLVVHTAGSVSKEVLKGVSSNYGVIYPLQSLRKEMVSIPEVPLLIDGNSPDMLSAIEDFANTISPKVVRAHDEQRLNLHVAAVVVSNFTNHLYALAEDFCFNEKVDFKMLLPLIGETATRLKDYSAKEMQTGPALRNDFVTLDKHMKLLMKYPKLRNLYIKITDSIMYE